MVSMSKAKHALKPLPKRFYKRAAYEALDASYVITLDGKNIRTPRGQLLQCASQQLAQHIATEWDAQEKFIDADAMPLTRLLNITIDRVAADRSALLAEIAAYSETDLLFYHAPMDVVVVGRMGADTLSSDAELAALQLQHFAPVLAWARSAHGLSFNITQSLMPVPQPPESLQKMLQFFAAANDHELAALAMMVPLLGSALLTLAVWEGAVDVEAALIAARLDEMLQEKKWGADGETTAKWSAKCRDVRACAFFLTCN